MKGAFIITDYLEPETLLNTHLGSCLQDLEFYEQIQI